MDPFFFMGDGMPLLLPYQAGEHIIPEFFKNAEARNRRDLGHHG